MKHTTIAAVRPAGLGAIALASVVLLSSGCAPMPLQPSLAAFNGKNTPFYLTNRVYTQIRPGAWFGTNTNVFSPDGPYLSEPAVK